MCQGINPQEHSQTQSAPRGMRYHIALVGRRNSGKSSLLNMLAGQQISIVSDIKGTTTDAVAKAYELQPLGPVTFYDTAGIDDEGTLGMMRVSATRRVLFRSDMALLVVDEHGLCPSDMALIDEIQQLEMPILVVFNKADICLPKAEDIAFCQTQSLPFIVVSAATGLAGKQLKQLMVELAPAEYKQEPLLAGDLYQAGDVILCVVPIDMAAPKGRLILPQVQILREALDRNAIAMVVKETELTQALSVVTPKLVISDAQAIKQVAATVPDAVPLTTFSTLFARFKGDLAVLAAGADALDKLQDGNKVLIAEACSHNVQEDDIGRVKLPRWINSYTGKQLQFVVTSGHDFPDDLEQYALVIHCGACMFNRNEMLRRIRECQRRQVPITNYGVAISKLQGVLPRVLAPFNNSPQQ
ncbi:[FeFe] hydrogenase H-cluster maturation GTPase HydF [Shewanella xiamenensis]|uniref:[FeFe] hydrogenase H-cluster maturation GTPase HydF n=1 Tax=Shewanella xiamenensis TaxID=332186 RepID=A0AAE4PZF5_9GAMM|nr:MULTISPECIES: [FeFe] hydrogenase H-cluster maturation GTPase HydF [Shewanella]MDV5391572.1 [FeFe] hydrogenase H-cluster maturation GTPase HydF [Shewanella xiamenensis]BDQ64873.1 [FeFe] hydrogenase H-cluster maturation GTPase HydF [Shewanella xiamenensis]GLD76232.1 [FeFe] hydrogenase H-cluster maturation GTPase HydF [Shewanella xiamenensis]